MKKIYSRNSSGRKTLSPSKGFTIVELLVVIVVIGILAAITIISYTGVSQRAIGASLQSDLASAKKQLQIYQTDNDAYPDEIDDCPTPAAGNLCISQPSGGNDFDNYLANNTTNPPTFTLDAVNGDVTYRVTNDSVPVAVTATSSPYMQTITAASCPVTRTQVQDARDSHTYWIQELADNKCWMLTNLGYAGGGTNTYSDTKTLTNGTGGSITYTVASYYVTPSTTNFTTEPTAPSVSTDGTGQYGYLYNFCGANGGQTGNGACSNTDSTAVNTTISICPAGWRLPTGNGGEFGALNTAINGGSTITDAGLIGTPWLAQRSGYWRSGFLNQGSRGYYWSSTQYSAPNAYYLNFTSTYVNPATITNKDNGFPVRCVAI
ncbi:MAG: FISUMP domain-containing protein [Candidatus Saccharimonadales bacterium]